MGMDAELIASQWRQYRQDNVPPDPGARCPEVKEEFTDYGARIAKQLAAFIDAACVDLPYRPAKAGLGEHAVRQLIRDAEIARPGDKAISAGVTCVLPHWRRGRRASRPDGQG
jgi:hypothetical protein